MSYGIRQTLDTLATSSTNLDDLPGLATSNIWVNEANPARVWVAVDDTVYRSTDGGATFTAMAAAPDTVNWIIEDPAVDNSVFIACGADLLNATDPTIGWAVLYPGPIGATARQFVRSRDGQVTWICYLDAPAGEALQRVETGALADIAVTDIRTLCLDNAATSLLATLYAITADDPAQIWSVDGLTGLSAHQFTSTFPSGATVNHMLADPDVDLIYTADSDSVDDGIGAVRKFFPVADQLLLFKAGASGQQAHMLGFGARASAPAEFLLMSNTVNPAGVYHYTRDSVWVFRPLPISETGLGVAIAADPFNADRWLAVFNDGDFNRCYTTGSVIHGAAGWPYSPLWITEDAGVTWTEIVINEPAGWEDPCGLKSVSFNDQIGNSWAAAFLSPDVHYTALVQGTGSTVTRVDEATDGSAPWVTGGADADWLLSVTFSSSADGTRYVDSAFHTPSGGAPADFATSGAIDRLPGTSRTAFIADNTIYSTTDYRAAQPTSLLTGLSADGISAGANAIYYSDGGDVVRIVDPLGAATTTMLTAGNGKTYPRVDRQTRTIMGVLLGGAVMVDDGVTTRTIAPPTGAALAGTPDGSPMAIEVMVRA